MRRAHLAKMEKGNEELSIEFFKKLNEIPVVNYTVETVTGVYSQAKGSNSLLNSTLGMAENVTQAVTNRITPIAQKVAPALTRVDDLAVKGLDQLTTALPVVQLKPEELYSVTKKTMETKLSPVVTTYNKATGLVCNNKLAKVYFDVYEYILNTAEKTLDIVLPVGDKHSEKNGHIIEKSPEDGAARPAWLLKQTYQLATTAARRLLGVAQSKVETASHVTDVVLKQAKLRKKETT